MVKQEQIRSFALHRLPDEPITDRAQVHIWFTDLDNQEAGIPRLSLLSPNEQARATRLKNPLAKQRYISSRIITRRILSNITGVPPDSLEFRRDNCGKPWLKPPASSAHGPEQGLLGFNLSHSENILGLAAGVGVDIGIDIEVVNPSLDALAIAEASLEQADVELVQSSPTSERNLVFYRLWTRREAFAKMQGHGVASDHVLPPSALPSSLHSFEFTLDEKEIVSSLSLRTAELPESHSSPPSLPWLSFRPSPPP